VLLRPGVECPKGTNAGSITANHASSTRHTRNRADGVTEMTKHEWRGTKE